MTDSLPDAPVTTERLDEMINAADRMILPDWASAMRELKARRERPRLLCDIGDELIRKLQDQGMVKMQLEPDRSPSSASDKPFGQPIEDFEGRN